MMKAEKRIEERYIQKETDQSIQQKDLVQRLQNRQDNN